jgi:hypothetical protein
VREFANESELLNFLRNDEPERYVFRGQTRQYESPMIPSGFREHFVEFNGPDLPLRWAGGHHVRTAHR